MARSPCGRILSKRRDRRERLVSCERPAGATGASTVDTLCTSDIPFGTAEAARAFIRHEILLNWFTAMFTICAGSGTK